MAATRRLLLIGAAAAVLLAAGIIINGLRTVERHPIEGIWRSDVYNNCMCDAYNFFVIADGRIVQYSDKHHTEYSAGHYAALGDGRYRVTLFHVPSHPSIWVVRPGKDSWTHGADDVYTGLSPSARRFYRPESQEREKAIIAGAATRDAKIEAATGKGKANQSGPANRSQPIRSETIRTPSAAGSRR